MPNFFTDNADLQFQFDHLRIEELVEILEGGYQKAKTFDYAPASYAEATENYRMVLSTVGDIAGEFVAPRAAAVDIEGATFWNGKVTLARGTREAMEQLRKAELMGMTLPRECGGLNFPVTVYTMAVEMISRADASLMNLFGLQDIAQTIAKFGDDQQRAEFLPKLASGECTGAMVLTEPEAGSDLQAVSVEAKQDEAGQWRLSGVKRFITNGCGDILLVLARSEAGTKDARGLSLYVCYGDDTVKVRRIEHKLGIHGSPTCELQFNDTPAQLIGKRKLGLIRYVMDLMNGARLGVSAQALGVAQAAYEGALEYAKVRKQFKKPIIEIPVVKNMLMDMRVSLEACRSLLYATARWVDAREKLEERLAELKAEGKPIDECRDRSKEASKVAALLTPVTKYVLTEAANKIAYDALQIHGGAGYMKEFEVERLTRDARITNIYEGTSQLQIVAAIGGVTKDILADHFDRFEQRQRPEELSLLRDKLVEIRAIFRSASDYVSTRDNADAASVNAEGLVAIYASIFIGYLLLDEAELQPRKAVVARRYIFGALAGAKHAAERITGDVVSDLSRAAEILI